jgi:hypothetical protein
VAGDGRVNYYERATDAVQIDCVAGAAATLRAACARPTRCIWMNVCSRCGGDAESSVRATDAVHMDECEAWRRC